MENKAILINLGEIFCLILYLPEGVEKFVIRGILKRGFSKNYGIYSNYYYVARSEGGTVKNILKDHLNFLTKNKIKWEYKK